MLGAPSSLLVLGHCQCLFGGPCLVGGVGSGRGGGEGVLAASGASLW